MRGGGGGGGGGGGCGANEAKVDQTTEKYFLLSDPFI